MADEAEHAAGAWVIFTGVLCDETTDVGNECRSNDLRSDERVQHTSKKLRRLLSSSFCCGQLEHNVIAA
uniref:Uncharacterized protein n=1 Tax=Hyaloperonospora arabidopsidis (strain Emoy2) TaxID=559515 RepID=M4BJL7_HYAAE